LAIRELREDRKEILKEIAMGKRNKELKVILFGATGMIGSGVLQSCLDDPGVKKVLVLGRSSCGRQDPKMKEVLHSDFFDLRPLAKHLKGYNTCLFPLGVTSVGLNEEQYSRVTYDLTLATAQALLKANPGMSFCYVSGQATDSSEKGPVMWARVKGRIENKLLSMRFKPAVMLRPAAIIPMKGIRSKTFWYQAMYSTLGPLLKLMLPVFPGFVTTSERVGRAMLKAARGEAGKPVLESVDINLLGS
jgi:uncharacterized protein YbjT (DUF2867 family)